MDTCGLKGPYKRKNSPLMSESDRKRVCLWASKVPSIERRRSDSDVITNSQRSSESFASGLLQFQEKNPTPNTMPKQNQTLTPQTGNSPANTTEIQTDVNSAKTKNPKKGRLDKLRNDIYDYGIGFDPSTNFPEVVDVLVSAKIEKFRNQEENLSQNDTKMTVETAKEVGDKAELGVMSILGTPLFSHNRKDEIYKGGGTDFSYLPLKRAGKEPMPSVVLKKPKPDAFFAYPSSVPDDLQAYSGSSENVISKFFTEDEKKVMRLPSLFEYAKPTDRSAFFPFLVVEAKSEVRGGVLFDAENQAAVAGTHCVRAMEHLLGIKRECNAEKDYFATGYFLKTIAFSCTFNAREACLWIHHAKPGGNYKMSNIDIFPFNRGVYIQNFNRVFRNIIDWGLGERFDLIKTALPGYEARSRQPVGSQQNRTITPPSTQSAEDSSSTGTQAVNGPLTDGKQSEDGSLTDETGSRDDSSSHEERSVSDINVSDENLVDSHRTDLQNSLNPTVDNSTKRPRSRSTSDIGLAPSQRIKF